MTKRVSLLDYNQKPKQRRTEMTVQKLADDINTWVRIGGYFWACGLIRETVNLWEIPANHKLLCLDAQTMAIHYITESEG